MTLPYTPVKLPGSTRRYIIKCRWCGTVIAEVDAPGVTVRRNQCPGRDCRMPVEAKSG